MKKNNIVRFNHPAKESEVIFDPLTETLRRGARKLLQEAVEAEVAAFMDDHAQLRDENGRSAVVRNGFLPERAMQTGIGPVKVKVPRTRDRSGQGLNFQSGIVPPYLRRARSVEELLPWLYLKGVSTGDFSEALKSLLGPEAPGLAPATIARLKSSWKDEYKKWRQRSLKGKRYVYLWADGVYMRARMEQEKQCLLVIIGATPEGDKELIGLWDGYRESAQSWKELMLDLKARGLNIPPELAIGDGALGFWKALREVFGKTRRQRCWFHKMGNVLNKLPKGLQKQATQKLQEIWMAPGRKKAEAAFDAFVTTFEAKYPKATECLTKDRDDLLTFYDFPAQHWAHIRTSNPIESTFATVRLRTAKTRGSLSRETALMMTFKLCLSAEKRWRKLNGSKFLGELIQGIRFEDGLRAEKRAA